MKSTITSYHPILFYPYPSSPKQNLSTLQLFPLSLSLFFTCTWCSLHSSWNLSTPIPPTKKHCPWPSKLKHCPWPSKPSLFVKVKTISNSFDFVLAPKLPKKKASFKSKNETSVFWPSISSESCQSSSTCGSPSPMPPLSASEMTPSRSRWQVLPPRTRLHQVCWEPPTRCQHSRSTQAPPTLLFAPIFTFSKPMLFVHIIRLNPLPPASPPWRVVASVVVWERMGDNGEKGREGG